MGRKCWRLLFLLTVAAATGGCDTEDGAEDVANYLVAHDLKTVDQELAVFQADLALFRECLKARGGRCVGTSETALPHSSQNAAGEPVAPVRPGSSQTLADTVGKLPASDPARSAHAVLAHPVVQQAAAVHNHLRGHAGAATPGVTIETGKTDGGTPSSTVTLDLDVDQGVDLHHSLLSSIGNTAWDSLHKHCRALVEKNPTDAELTADCRRASFIRGYLGAYFRHGEFVEIDVDPVKARGGSVEQDLIKRINAADSKLSNVVKVSNAGFVSRDATFSARLPTIEVTVDPAAKRLLGFKDVDSGQVLTGKSDLVALGVATDTSGVGTGDKIGAELLRIFLEAVFDAGEGLPAIYPANVTDLEPTGLTLGDYSLPRFTAPLGEVDAGDLTEMTQLNDRVATQTRVIVGRVIEGIGPFSLNNRALESFLVELITVSIRKAVEKATWCFYACDLNADLDRLRAGVETAGEKEIEQEARAEEVRLRLKLGR